MAFRTSPATPAEMVDLLWKLENEGRCADSHRAHYETRKRAQRLFLSWWARGLLGFRTKDSRTLQPGGRVVVKREQGDSGPVGRRGVFVQMCGAFAGGLLVLFDDVTPKVFSIREWGDVIDGEVAVGPRGALTPKEPST